MSLPVVFRPEAEADVTTARAWYENQQSGLGDEFTDALAKHISLIGNTPKMFAIALNGVRRVKLQRFPYVVYYRDHSDSVEVIAVLDGRRDAKVWQRRI